ncbi:MAG: amidohydrolase family protein, partial [Myxococcota bacterium]
VVADWLSPDELEAFALHGTYPRMAFTDDGDLVTWAAGKLWRIDAETSARTEIPFRATGAWTMHDVRRSPIAIPDTVHAKVIRWPTLSSRGSWAFSALGSLYVRAPDGAVTRIGDGTGYAPAWSPDGKWLAWTSWDDETGGALNVTGPNGKTETLPVHGQLTNPAWSEDGGSIAVLRGAGGGLAKDDLANEPWYEVTLLQRAKGQPRESKGWTVTPVAAIDGQDGARKTKLALHDGRVWWFEFRDDAPRKPQIAVLRSMALDGTDARDHLTLGSAEEVVVSPDFQRVAFRRGHQLYVTALPRYARDLDVDALPIHQVTHIVGDWLGFSPDGKAVTWVQGDTIEQIPVDGLWDDASDDDDEDDDDDDADREDPLAPDPRVVSLPIAVEVPRERPTGVVVLANARVIPMDTDQVLDGVNVVIDRDRIVEIGPGATRPGARVIDVTGKTVIPGFVDVHAHLHFTASDILPEQEWRYQTALDFGVTTVHDPSANTDLVFTQSERVEAGLEDGPRVWSTGSILYGALATFAADTPNPAAAVAHVRRLEAVGARTVKVYQQSQRDRRQWYAVACRAEGVSCVPEGGGDLFMDLGMVVDGYQAIEHALPETPLYADVRGLFAGSRGGSGDGLGTFHTPTLQVAYGGLSGKHWFEQHENPVDDPRLRRHTPTRWLEADQWRHELMAQDEDWRFRSTAIDDARLQADGVHVTLGAHGELQGLGVHWELWALGGPGAMSAQDALRAATIEGARYLGLDRELGSVTVGKLADLVVLDADPLADLHASTKIAFVVKNGEVFE